MTYRRSTLLLCLALFVFCLPADLLKSDDVNSTSTISAAKTTAEPCEIEIGETAIIETLIVVYPTVWPDEIEVVIIENFPDECTEFSNVLQSRDDNKFLVKLITSRSLNVDCTMALEPFAVSVPLDLTGLEEGFYEIEVYARVIDFEIGQLENPEEQRG